MSTRIEVNVEGSGLAGRNRQQMAANRQAQAERELRARAEARARVQREEFLASQGLNPDGSPNAEYQNLRRGRFVGDDPAAYRRGNVCGYLADYTNAGIEVLAENSEDTTVRVSNFGYTLNTVKVAKPVRRPFETSYTSAVNPDERTAALIVGAFGEKAVQVVSTSSEADAYVSAASNVGDEGDQPARQPISVATAWTAEFDFAPLSLVSGFDVRPWFGFGATAGASSVDVRPVDRFTQGTLQLTAAVYGETTLVFTQTIPSPIADTGTWSRLSLTWSGANVYMHLNGQLALTVLAASLPNRAAVPSGIGQSFTGVKAISIGSMRLFHKALYGAENYEVKSLLR